MKKLAEKDITLEGVTSRLIKEADLLKMDGILYRRAGSAISTSHICHKSNNDRLSCFLSPTNPHDKLNLPGAGASTDCEAEQGFSSGKEQRKGKNKSSAKSGQQCAMACGRNNNRRPHHMRSGRNTTSHLRRHASWHGVNSRTSFQILLRATQL